MCPLRVALFVEGSEGLPSQADHLSGIWNECLATALGIDAFSPVVPISKKHIVAMDPANPPMSGASERLDQLMVRVMKRKQFDAAVVAWDLVPAWNSSTQYCRWNETVSFYRLLKESTSLSDSWKREAQIRFDQLSKRERGAPTNLSQFGVLALCMEPMFEGILVQDEGAIRRVLGVGSKQVKGWPRTWDPAMLQPDRDLLIPALAAVRRYRPKLSVARRVRGDFRTNKSGWGCYLLRGLLDDPRVREAVLAHPIAARLGEYLQSRSERPSSRRQRQ